jgi:hypothetical protein
MCGRWVAVRSLGTLAERLTAQRRGDSLDGRMKTENVTVNKLEDCDLGELI